MYRLLVCPGNTSVNPYEFNRIVTPPLPRHAPTLTARLRDPTLTTDNYVTIEIRLDAVAQTVDGVRGLWWDELLGLIENRLNFISPEVMRERFPHTSVSMDLDCLSPHTLWEPTDE